MDLPAVSVQRRLGSLLGSRAVTWRRAPGETAGAGRWIVELEDERTAFVKVGSDSATRSALRAEAYVYSTVHGQFLPRMLAWRDTGEHSLLVLEDLSRERWPPPWTDGRVARVMQSLHELSGTSAPGGLPSLEAYRAQLSGWTRVAEAPAPFLSIGLVSQRWLDAALPRLLRAQRSASLVGSSLVHLDVRSGNICLASDRTLLVDWVFACHGNPLLDLALWLPSLEMEGGSQPEEHLPRSPELAALVSGFLAARAGLPPRRPDQARLRQAQRLYLGSALAWAQRALNLPPYPDDDPTRR